MNMIQELHELTSRGRAADQAAGLTRAVATQASVGRLLALGVLKGRWPLEAFDEPSGSAIEARAWRAAHGLPEIPHRNSARDWIESHADEWDAMLRKEMAAELEAAA